MTALKNPGIAGRDGSCPCYYFTFWKIICPVLCTLK